MRVRKGERATHILAPCIRKVDDPKADGGKRTVVYGFRAIDVTSVWKRECDDRVTIGDQT